jgi:hypothetical protein
MSKRTRRFNIILDGDPDSVAKSCKTLIGAKYWLWFVDPQYRKDLSIVECSQVVVR